MSKERARVCTGFLRGSLRWAALLLLGGLLTPGLRAEEKPAVQAPERVAEELLRPGADGRVQLFSVARLTERDRRNPFEIRVQVRVDVREIEVIVGGVVEGLAGRERPAVLLTVKPPVTVTKRQMMRREEAQQEGAATAETDRARKPHLGKEFLCVEGDAVEGFKIREIRRDRVVLEMMGKLIEVPRSRPVVVCVPLSAGN